MDQGFRRFRTPRFGAGGDSYYSPRPRGAFRNDWRPPRHFSSPGYVPQSSPGNFDGSPRAASTPYNSSRGYYYGNYTPRGGRRSFSRGHGHGAQGSKSIDAWISSEMWEDPWKVLEKNDNNKEESQAALENSNPLLNTNTSDLNVSDMICKSFMSESSIVSSLPDSEANNATNPDEISLDDEDNDEDDLKNDSETPSSSTNNDSNIYENVRKPSDVVDYLKL